MADATVIAEAPSGCCFTGVQHSGTPVGSIVNIVDIDTYISGPPTGNTDGAKKVLIFFADVWSPVFINNKLIQDYFASHGYTVLGPDYFFGDAIYKHTDPDFDRGKWISDAREFALPKIAKWIDVVKEKYGTADTKWHAVGYCFGAPFTLELAATDLLSSAAIAHPAFLTEDHFKNINNVPLFLSCAETDHTFGLENRRRAEDLLLEKKAVYHFQVFSGVSHGFAVRGNPEVEHERWAKEESARSIIGWFDRFSKLAKTGL